MASNLQNLLRGLTVGQVGNSGVYTGRSFLDNAARQAASQAARRGAQAASYSNTPLGEYRRQHSEGGSSSGGGDGILGTLGNIGMGALTALDMPRRLVVSGVKEGADALGITDGEASFGDFVGQVKDGIGFGDIIGDATDNKWVNRALGFAGDVLLDPLTYVTGGASTVGKLERFGAASRAASLSDDTLRNLGTTRDALVSRLSTKGVGGLDDATREAIGGLKQSGLYFGGSKRGVRIAGTGGIDRAVGGRLAGLRNRITQSSPWERLSSLRDPEGMEAPFRVLRHGYDKNGQLTPTAAALTFGFNEAYKGGKNEVGSLWARSYENLFDGMDEKSRQQLVASTENGLDDPKFRDVMSQVREQLVREGIDVGDLGDTFVPHQWTAEALRLLNGESEAARKLRKALKVKRLERRGTFKPRVIKAGSEIEIDGTVIRFEKGTIAEINEKLSEAVNWSGVTKWLEDDPSKILPRYLNQAADAVGQARGLKYLLESGGDLVGKLSLMSTDQLDEFATKAANKEVRKQLRQVVKARDAAVRQQYEAAVQQIDDFRGPIVDALRARIASLGAVGDRATKRLEALAAKKATLEESARVVKAEAGQLKVRISQQKKRLEKEFFELEAELQELEIRVVEGPSANQTWDARAKQLFDENEALRGAQYQKLAQRRAQLVDEIARNEEAVAQIEALDEAMSIAAQLKRQQSELLNDPEAMRLMVEEGNSDLFVEMTEVVNRVVSEPTSASRRLAQLNKQIAEFSDVASDVKDVPGSYVSIARADEQVANAMDLLDEADKAVVAARKKAGRDVPLRGETPADNMARTYDYTDAGGGRGFVSEEMNALEAELRGLSREGRDARRRVVGAENQAAREGRELARIEGAGNVRRTPYQSMADDGTLSERIDAVRARIEIHNQTAATFRATLEAVDQDVATIAERAAEIAFGDPAAAEDVLRRIGAEIVYLDASRTPRINTSRLAGLVDESRRSLGESFNWMTPEDRALFEALASRDAAANGVEAAKANARKMREVQKNGGFAKTVESRRKQRLSDLRQRQEAVAREVRVVGESVNRVVKEEQSRMVPIIAGSDGRLPYEADIVPQASAARDALRPLTPKGNKQLATALKTKRRVAVVAADSIDMDSLPNTLPSEVRDRLGSIRSSLADNESLIERRAELQGGGAVINRLSSEQARYKGYQLKIERVERQLDGDPPKYVVDKGGEAVQAWRFERLGELQRLTDLQAGSRERIGALISSRQADMDAVTASIMPPRQVREARKEAERLLDFSGRWEASVVAGAAPDEALGARITAEILQQEIEAARTRIGRGASVLDSNAQPRRQLSRAERAAAQAAGVEDPLAREAFVDELVDAFNDFDEAQRELAYHRRALNRALREVRGESPNVNLAARAKLDESATELADDELSMLIGGYAEQGGFFGEARLSMLLPEGFEAGDNVGFQISSYDDPVLAQLQSNVQIAQQELDDGAALLRGFFDTSVAGRFDEFGVLSSTEVTQARKSDFGVGAGRASAVDPREQDIRAAVRGEGSKDVRTRRSDYMRERLQKAYKEGARAKRRELKGTGARGVRAQADRAGYDAWVQEAYKLWEEAPQANRDRFVKLVLGGRQSEANFINRQNRVLEDLGFRNPETRLRQLMDEVKQIDAELKALKENPTPLSAERAKVLRAQRKRLQPLIERADERALQAGGERVVDWRAALGMPSRELGKLSETVANKERVARAYVNLRQIAEGKIEVAERVMQASDVAAAESVRPGFRQLDTPAAQAVRQRDESASAIGALQREIPRLEREIRSTRPLSVGDAQTEAAIEQIGMVRTLRETADRQVSISQDVDQLDAMRARLGAKPEDLDEVKEIRRKQSLLTIAERGEKAILDDATAQVKAAEKGLTDVQKMKIGGGRTLKQAQKNVDAQMNELEALVQIARRDPSPETAVAVGLFNDLLNTVKELPKSVEQLDYFKAMSQAAKDGELVQVFKQVANDGFMEIGEILGRDNMLVAEQGLARAIQEIEKAMDNGSLLEMIDIGNRFFKTYATLSPGFHFRNMMGATFMNASDGVGVAEHRRAYKLWGDMKRSKNPQQFFDNLSDGDKVAFDAVYASGASGRLSFGEVGAENAVNPMARRILESGASKKVLENRLVRWSRSVGQDWVEGPIRLAMALDSVGRGQNLTQASARIQRIHFDYSQMSRFDRRAKAVFPFWMFMSRNLPLQIQQMLAKPRLYQVYSNFARNMNDENVKQQLWQEERSGIGLVPASMLFGKRQGLVLVPDLQHISMMEDIKKANPMEFPRILSNSNPMYRVPLELAMDRKFFNDQPFYPNENKLEYAALQTLPPVAQAARLSATTSKYEDRSKLQSLLNYLGIPLYGVDQQQAAESAARRAAK
ncbi:MAG: hypothetical protein ACO3O3_08880 [Ilumatobacteraceae bacterium]